MGERHESEKRLKSAGKMKKGGARTGEKACYAKKLIKAPVKSKSKEDE